MTKIESVKDLILFEIRQHNQDEPITGKILGEKFGLKDSQIRTFVNELRCSGHQIASDGRGYWWAQNEAELEHTHRSFLSRISAMRDADKGMFQAFNKQDELTLELR